MNFEERFYHNIKISGLLKPGHRILLAVSGGLDSVVLSRLLHPTGMLAALCHCNFQLRGAESEGDAQFVRTLAVELDVPIFVTQFATRELAAEKGVSIQMAARDLRYAWFAELCREQNFDCVATAHHLNDAVETTLLNLTRGTGIAGLTGIATLVARNEAGGADDAPDKPVDCVVVRPLLWATRAEIQHYAQENGIAWREDSSNHSDDYARNFIRHQIVPRLEELNPNFLHTTERTMQRMHDLSANYAFMARQMFGDGDENTTSEYAIQKSILAQFPAPAQVLLELLRPYDFDPEQSRQMAENLEHTGLELVSKTGWRLLNDRLVLQLIHPAHGTALVQITIDSTDLMVKLPDGDRLFMVPSERPDIFPDGRNSIVLDPEKLQFPLHLRPWQSGDAFQPFGMHGHSQKLQDYFTNEKVSRLEKEKTWVLVNGDATIIWVVGFRLDERFKIVPDTRKFLKINKVSL